MTARGPAYRIETERLVVRCWDPADAPLLDPAVRASLDHLRPWMPWAAREPIGLEARVDLLRRFRGDFDLDRDALYGIFDRDESSVLGGTGLHHRVGEGARDIGYWIHADHTGKGLATEATAALTRIAFEVEGVERLEIRCDPANARSAAVPARLGFVHEATLRQRLRYPEPRDEMLWSMLVDDYPEAPPAGAELEAFDAAGRRLL